MHSVLTQKGVLAAFATQVTLEMGSTVQVRYGTIIYTCLASVKCVIIYSAWYHLQILMSVNMTRIHVTPMPTALTQRVALTVNA